MTLPDHVVGGSETADAEVLHDALRARNETAIENSRLRWHLRHAIEFLAEVTREACDRGGMLSHAHIGAFESVWDYFGLEDDTVTLEDFVTALGDKKRRLGL